jgi:hypothetical protein
MGNPQRQSFQNNPEQIHDHCSSAAVSGKFSGAGFLSGDDYIAKCAARIWGHQ